MRKEQGFTLIEIAIVLVIIGLLLGGVLKGQELIQSARVRNLISHQDGVKAAYFGFLDRYRALPGDYSQAQANIPNCSGCQQGDNNGQISSAAESISAWEHLSKAGFITGSYVYSATAPTDCIPASFPRWNEREVTQRSPNDAIGHGAAGSVSCLRANIRAE